MGGRRLVALIAAVVAVACLLWLALPRTSTVTATSPQANGSGSANPASSGYEARARTAVVAPPAVGGNDVAHPGAAVKRKVAHSIDPCERVVAPEIPDGYETLAAAGVTIAWDPEVAIEPTTLAYLSAGLLAQIGIVTGTQPRNDVVVIVYPSLDDFRAKTGAPEWSDGQYDGAVRVPAARGDFGIAIHTLRHELMHAQLHATIGCMPIWLNEGAAQYFANTVGEREWLHMLKARAGIEPNEMQVGSIEDVHADTSAAYAQSLAMVVYMFAHGDSLADVLHDKRGPANELWKRRFPDASEHDVLDAVARRVFGIATGPELDAILGGDVCCRSWYSLSDFVCHAAPREKSELCRTTK